MNKYLFIFFILSLLAARSTYSQSSTDSLLQTSTDSTNSLENEFKDQTPLTAGFSYIYGFAIPHAKEVVNIRGTNPIGYEVNFNWLLYTNETWDDCHCYPRLGFHLGFYDFDINEIFGYGYEGGLNFTYYFGLLSNFNFLLQGKAGLSYLTKPYDEETHPENMSYSTHLNYLLSAGAGIRFAFSDFIESSFLINFNHNSNAALTEPNGGINYPAVSLTLGYTFNPIEIKPRTHPDPYLTAENKNRWDIGLFWGISSMPFPDPTQVPMYGINILRSWQVMRFGAVTAGAEMEMNGRARLRDQRGTIEIQSPWRGSVLAGWEFLMGRTIFSIQLGFYLYRPHKELDDVYQRFGLTYKVVEHLTAGIGFKSYRHYADHLDLRIIYTF
ncbi:MAG: acyloxyacyl hydrolase [Ignavibacteriaceae bacterium]|nr:acyloxyacyl hydrolase [Ignavibacteriaceae bacterium]